ncbi:MAG: hypothetical protein E7661_07710 [Ruminococcaceae bacterium]|nr:hypothetical protein [Oscillospiraceae bacterium]
MSKKQKNLTRIPVIDWLSFWLTLGLVVILMGAMVAIYYLGWDGHIIGNVVTIIMALFFCMLFVDLGFLLSACVTVGEGAVNMGKDEQGNLMVFHADKVERIEVRDLACHILPEDRKVYKRVKLTFVMESGRVHERKLNRLTEKQLARIREAVAAEAKKST